ncbi:MAG: serine/threonine-protein kinase [Streptosporangiaceae bacterium]
MSRPALVEPLRRWDPEQVGGYVLIGRLGAGAMGRVYLGRSAAGRLVAVKTIKVELAEEPDFRTRFAQEVAAARRVSGAFTAAVVAADPEADIPWLATAYVPAPSLSTLIRTCGPLPVLAVRWLAAGCAEALESIHGAGLVHRDLKPSNVLVSLDGPRVIDFGVARAAERIQLTVTRGAVGTPAYMAPEQARDTRQATMASDVFSLGGTMLYAATGHAPYQGETVMDVLVRLATEAPDLSGLPPGLAGIVVACLDRDPRKRPDSAAVLADMAPYIGAGGEGGEAGATSLPAAALALMADYRQEPRPAAAASAEAGEDATLGSQPAGAAGQVGASGQAVQVGQLGQLVPVGQGGQVGHIGQVGPAGKSLARRRAARGLAGAHHGHGGETRASGVPGLGRPRWRRRLLLLASAVGAAAVLMAAGAAIGLIVNGGRAPRAPALLPPPLPPPATAASAASARHPGQPEITMSQPAGDSWTSFVVTGRGWPPGRSVTVALAGVGASPDRVRADGAGTFSYRINQDNEFFPGAMPLRVYHVVVTAPGGARAVASFTVNRR